MEDDRKGKPVAALGGMYAKAKQRVLNRLGKRTTYVQLYYHPFYYYCYYFYYGCFLVVSPLVPMLLATCN
jgi:hypothetical protein